MRANFVRRFTSVADYVQAMTAGESAQRHSESATRAAEALEAKARTARGAAERWAAGAEGERTVAQILAPLAAEGWYQLHDRLIRAGGNVDHILIGPGGVVVIDAKAWKSATVKDGKLFTGTWNKQEAVDKLRLQSENVRHAAGPGSLVLSILAMVNQPDMPPTSVDDVTVVGIDQLADLIRNRGYRYSVADAEEILRKVTIEIPHASAAPPDMFGQVDVPSGEFRGQFAKAHQLFYFHEWRKGGLHRLYLKDHEDIDHGYRDLIGQTIHQLGDDPLARMLLDCGTVTGPRINPSGMPKITIDVFGGRMLGTFARRHMSVIVGHLWRQGSKARLYGTLASPSEPVFKLGFVDLRTGYIKPETEGDLSKWRGPAATYLATLRDSYPDRERYQSSL